MLKSNVKRMMEREFKKGSFKSMTSTYLINREATNGSFDPVTEEYTGGTNGLESVPIVGMMRSVERVIADRYDLSLDHQQLTILQRDWLDTSSPGVGEDAEQKPKQNDEIDTEAVDGSPVRMRVVGAEQDAARIFYKLILKRAS